MYSNGVLVAVQQCLFCVAHTTGGKWPGDTQWDRETGTLKMLEWKMREWIARVL